MRYSAEISATITELLKHGATFLKVTTGGKHKRVHYRYGARESYMVCSGTGSDHRGPDNARQAVRRSLGIERGKTVGKRRIHKDRAVKVTTEPTKMTAGRDPWATMKGTPIAQAAAAVAADRAWNMLFGACLVNAGRIPQHPAIREALGSRS